MLGQWIVEISQKCMNLHWKPNSWWGNDINNAGIQYKWVTWKRIRWCFARKIEWSINFQLSENWVFINCKLFKMLFLLNVSNDFWWLANGFIHHILMTQQSTDTNKSAYIKILSFSNTHVPIQRNAVHMSWNLTLVDINLKYGVLKEEDQIQVSIELVLAERAVTLKENSF